MSVSPQQISFYKIEKIDERDVDYFKSQGVNIGFRAEPYQCMYHSSPLNYFLANFIVNEDDFTLRFFQAISHQISNFFLTNSSDEYEEHLKLYGRK